MNVYGVRITEAQISAAHQAMTGEFTAKAIEQALHDAGLDAASDFHIRSRAADRLLQKSRKAGIIKANGIRWHRVQPATTPETGGPDASGN